jgi:hypothetical protein
MTSMEGYITWFACKNRFVMSNACSVRFSLAPSEYCVGVTDALHVPLLHDIALPGYTRVEMLYIIVALYNALI